MATGPAAPRNRWTAHPWRARGLRLLVYVLPIVLSLAFVHLATALASPPTSSLWMFLIWWLSISAGATAVVCVVYALSRRLLPLGALLELSLVFPDEAPSRFQLALRTKTVDSLEERTRLMRDAKEAQTALEASEILLRLVASLSVHDSITRGHAERVRAYSFMLGRQIGLADDELDRLNWAALLHDIGKLEVSQEILNKDGRPTDEEWQSLRRHPEYGETLVEPLRGWLGDWLEAVGHHHERWDGRGYPRGLAEQSIPRAGRIVAIADVFDVITSARSYKEPTSAADARAEIVRCSGTQFDPRLVRAFVGISLGKMRLVMGPLSWLTHAPLLARLPLTPSVGAAVGGFAAVVAATTTAIVGPTSGLQAAVLRDDRAAPRALSAPDGEGGLAPRVPGRRGAPGETLEPGTAPGPGQGADPKQGPGSAAAPDAPGAGPGTSGQDDGRPGSSDEPSVPGAPGGTDPPASPGPEGPADDDPPASPEPDPDPPRDPTPSPPPDRPPPPQPPAPTPPQPQAPPPPPPPPPPTPNQPPSFAGGGNQSVLEDAGGQSASGWASGISPGPASESSQTVAFLVSNDNAGLFSAQPAVAPGGTLTYAPVPNASGVATVTVRAVDDGGTANGGDDTSAPIAFTITVEPVNDAPSFNGGGNQTAISVLGAQSVSGWATGISVGPANESSQGVNFVVTVSNPGLFAVQPAVSPDGTLTYTPKLVALGTTTVTVRAVDSGGTANGGDNTSPAHTFTITIV